VIEVKNPPSGLIPLIQRPAVLVQCSWTTASAAPG
jgi:hypothetical protein